MRHFHFPGLNGIRFLAAFLVLLDHTELIKGYLGLPTLWSETYSAHLGSTGVTIFFVLSGFLITYLLFMEKSIGPIHIQSFYIRRILRIWPLYYLIFILGFFVLPYFSIFHIPGYSSAFPTFPWDSFWAYGTLLANYGFIYCVPIAYAGILWSVAVEEQFYLIWPWVVRHVQSPVRVFLGILLFYLLLKTVAYFPGLGIKAQLPNQFYYWLDRTRISCMVIGGIGAVMLYHQKTAILNFLYSKTNQYLQLFLFTLILSNVLDSGIFNFIKNEILAVNVMMLLLNISSNPQRLWSLENRLFDFLGKISYGLYVYHLMVVVMVVKSFLKLGLYVDLPTWLGGLMTILTTTLLSILIAHLSYRYFESYFLRKKEKFSVIKTG